ncbi:MAG: SMI1/KNR4 family protein [Kordia sp.]|uniref:SMI1/KNR4 family protein n=1 Tax=Kordia sp. TaxID=1965332 RepID=UPI0038595C79
MKIIESEKNINIIDINNLEEKYNVVFPENFKKLYLKYNGGLEETGEDIVDELYSIKYGKSTIEIVRDSLQISENNIPLYYLLFATTGVGHQIGVNLEDDSIVLFRKDDLKPEVIANSLENLLKVNSIEEL